MRGTAQNLKSQPSCLPRLRRGIHSYVQLALDRQTGEHVAIKLLRRDMLDVDAVTREVQNQRACASHPHIVQLLVRRFSLSISRRLAIKGVTWEVLNRLTAPPRTCADSGAAGLSSLPFDNLEIYNAAMM